MNSHRGGYRSAWDSTALPLNAFMHVAIRPTETARRLLDGQGIDLNDAMHVVRNFLDSWNGKYSGEWWVQGKTPQGLTLQVLVFRVHGDSVEMRRIHLIDQGVECGNQIYPGR